jgi:hypothetical protein
MAGKKQAANEVVIADGSELGDLLRRMIDESEVTRYAISRATGTDEKKGITEAALSRMYNGGATTTLATLARVADALGKSVVVRVQ